MAIQFSQTMPKNLNQEAKNGNQNVYQAALIEAADLLKINLFIQPLHSLPNLGQNTGSVHLIQKVLKGCARIFQHIQMASYLSQTQTGYDAVLFTHFLNIPVFFTFLFSGFRSKNIYLLAHYMQQVANNKFYFGLFRFYIWLGYTFLVFEETNVLKQLGFSKKERMHFMALPHPVMARPAYKKRTTSAQKWVGLIGEVRSEKNIDSTLNTMLALQKELGFKLILGAQDVSAFPQVVLNEDIQYMNTTSTAGYFEALAACDVVVLNYDEKNYALRASGVIADAAGTRTYSVCPDYPFMRHQVLWPAPIGVVFNQTTDLPRALQQALSLPDARLNPAFEAHYASRSANEIAQILATALFQDKETNHESPA